ncbi:hypothetical protein NLI96_g8346 [Meripilus lineatus]|uniref:DUF300-domain-containing protein n=1 Tax=Meripilus lineatus TaxID=2056292 RepID=A0AAD5UZR1_9APHY|nr:hypothetical protein NLI96_g8346 [Physisporinus lineatus]
MLSLLPDLGSGSGSALPLPVLIMAGIATVIATIVSATSIYLQLKNYRKPILQRMVIRIMVMVPLYAIASFISLFSVQAAFFIDAIRDVYEAFVIYCFFDLLVAYLGGERSLLILLHGRPPKYPVFPGNIFWREVDVSDPYTFLFLKRGVLQYVQVKPILALATIILKAVGQFREGDLRADSGYLYVSLVYNISICMSLYCLAIFWMCVNDDLKPFRPMPKFLCVKGILFFSFWQSLFISILVAAGAITKLGPYTDPEHISLGLTDTLICLEMPFFAIAHQYAFSTRDYVDPLAKFVARMPIYYAFRDAFGLKDVVEDSKATLRGEGMDYREFEPSEGQIHQGAGRDRRIRAGLRYSQGGKRKYWLPQTANSPPGAGERRLNRAIEYVTGRPDQGEEVYAPLLDDQADDVVHIAPDLRPQQFEDPLFGLRSTQEGGFELPFGDLDDEDEELYEHSKKYIFGDYNYPCVDISNEEARIRVWNEEERILRDERGIFVSPSRGPGPGLGRILGSSSREGYGAVGNFQRPRFDSDASSNNGGSRHGKNTYSPSMRQAVIDKEQDRWDNATTATSHSHSQGELRLQWTRTKAKTPSPNLTPRLRTISSQGPDQASSSSLATPSPSQGGSPRDRWKPSSSIHPEPDNDHSTLPPDAVDLIVEDNRALQAEMTHERRKGEPAVRPHGLRKVYRRGYVVEEDEGRVEGEVEVEDPDPDSGGRGEDGRDLGAVLQVEEEAVETIARAVTPPAHARIFVDSYALGSEDNPWA